MSLDYMGIRKGDGDLTVDAGVTLILPADKTARSYGHIEVLGVFDIEGTFHNGGSIELGPVGSLVINGHLYNMLTFVLNGGEGYDLPVEYDYAYEFYLPTSADVHYAGFIFGGWFDDPGFDEGPVTVIPAHSAEARTFYAKWYGGTPCGENLYYAVDEQHVLMIVIQGADT